MGHSSHAWSCTKLSHVPLSGSFSQEQENCSTLCCSIQHLHRGSTMQCATIYHGVLLVSAFSFPLHGFFESAAISHLPPCNERKDSIQRRTSRCLMVPSIFERYESGEENEEKRASKAWASKYVWRKWHEKTKEGRHWKSREANESTTSRFAIMNDVQEEQEEDETCADTDGGWGMQSSSVVLQ